MLVYPSETSLPQGAPMPFWLLITYFIQIAYHSPFAPGVSLKTTKWRDAQSLRAQY